MKLPRNLSDAVTGITGGRKNRRAERKAQRIADKGGVLKKQIADAQARTELPTEGELPDVGAAREKMLEAQNAERLYTQLQTVVEKQADRLGDALLVIAELAARVVELEDLQKLGTEALEQVTGALERTEKAVNELSKRLGEACLTIDESLSGLDKRVTPIEAAINELDVRLTVLADPETGAG